MDQMTTPLERPGLPDTSAPLFHADASGAPSLGQHPALDLLADLAMHDQAQTPLTIGLFGAPGAGKSHALQTLGRRARALAEAAGPQSPFLDHVIVVAVDAQDLQADAARGVAIALREGLLARGPKSLAARLDGKAVEAATDPLAAAQEAAQQLDDARRQLAAEQRDLTELTAQRAHLNDAVLFESGHTQVDDYARRHRKQLETRLNSFGFGGDAKAVFKTLVGELADRPGLLARLSTLLNSVWTYGGQARLLAWALASFVMAWILGLAEGARGEWLTSLRNASESTKEPANWLEAHANWLGFLGQAAITVGLLCIALNLWRAARFTIPLLEGARLLEEEVEKRGGELDGLITKQAERVAQRMAATNTLTARVDAADLRARERSASGPLPAADLFAEPRSGAPALSPEAYLDAIEARLGGTGAPQRILVLLDGLEALPAQQAAATVDAAHHCLARSGFVLAMAADAGRLALGWGGGAEAATRLERYVQAPFAVRMIRDEQASIAYAHQILGAAAELRETPPDATTSALDRPIKPVETHLLAKLSTLAGDTPRAVKRYLNRWRLARPLTDDGGALALMLALDNGATAGELAAMGAAMDLEEPQAPLAIHPGEPRLAAALACVNALRQSPLTNGQAHAAWMIARDFSIPTG